MRRPLTATDAVRSTGLKALVTVCTSVALAVGSSAGFGLALSGCSESEDSSITEVPFTSPDGRTASVADFAGRPLVLNMWATNCAPCVKEMPAFDEVATEQQEQVQIIGVNVFDSPADAEAFAADLGVRYPQYTDPNGALSSALAVTGLPATAFFDSNGKLVIVHQGAYTADELRAAIAEYFPDLGSGEQDTDE